MPCALDIFAARDLANTNTERELRSPRAISAADNAVSKAKFLVEIIERKLP